MKSMTFAAAVLFACLLPTQDGRAQSEGPRPTSFTSFQQADTSITVFLRPFDRQAKSYISGATVSLKGSGGTIVGRETSDRLYSFTLKPGTYDLSVTKAGYQSLFQKGIPIGANANRKTNNVYLDKAAAQNPNGGATGEFRFAVYDGAGQRRHLGGASVTIRGQGRTVSATDRGRYYSATLAPGQYVITASKAGYKSQFLRINLDKDPKRWSSPTMTLAAASQNQPDAGAKSYPFSIRVLDSKSRKFLSGAKVSIRFSDYTSSAKEYTSDFVYGFTSLRPGTYRVSIQKAGYASQSSTITVKAGLTGNSATVYLAQAGGTPPATDAKSFTAYLQAVDNQTGANLSGATVSMTLISTGGVVSGREVNSGRSRLYRLDLKPGKYRLTVTMTGYKNYSEVITLGATAPTSAKVVRLTRATQPAAKTSPYSISVRDSRSRKFLSGATVSIRFNDYTASAKEYKSDFIYGFDSLKPGTYRVSIQKTGYTSQVATITVKPGLTGNSTTVYLKSSKPGPDPAPRQIAYRLRVIDDVTSRPLFGVTVAIAKSRITTSSLPFRNGRTVADVGNHPHGGDKLFFTSADIAEPRTRVASTFQRKRILAVEKRGVRLNYNYEAQLDPGRYDVAVSKDGYETATFVAFIASREGLPTVKIVRLKPKRTTPALYTLWVKVSDDAGNVVSGATVNVSTIKVALSEYKESRGWYGTQLPAGRYSVTVSKTGYVASAGNSVLMGLKKEVQLPIRLKQTTTPLPAGRPLQVRVVDDASSEPLSGVTVSIKASGPRGATVSATEVRKRGSFYNYAATLLPGTYKLTAFKKGYESQTVDVSVPRERIRALPAIRLKRRRTTPTLITLWLQAIDDATGAVIPAPTIAVTSGTDKEKLGTSKDWYYAQVESGSYKVAIAKTGYTSREVTVRVGSETVTRKIRLKRLTTPKPPTTPSYTLKIRVEDERGTLIRNPFVLIKAGTDTFRSTLQSGYYASRVQPGTYKVTVTKTGYVPEGVTVAIRESDVTRRIILKRTSIPDTPKPPVGKLALTIAVIDIKSKAIVGATVTITSPAKAGTFAETAGTHKADGLKSGAYSVTISKAGYKTETRDYTLGLTSRKATVILRRVAPSEFVLRVAGLDESKSPILTFQASGGPGITVASDRQRYYSTKLKPGTYEVEFKKKGYETVTRIVTIRDADEKLDVDLKKLKRTVIPPPVTPVAPVKSQAGGVPVNRGARKISASKGSSKGGIPFRRVNPVKRIAEGGKPGGLRFQPPANAIKKPTTNDPPDNGTLRILRKA